MVLEDGIDWQPIDPDKRGRFKDFSSAVAAAASEMLVERNPFFDSLPDRWEKLFPGLPAKPGRYEDGTIFIYVRNAPTNFAVRPKLPMIKRKLAAEPDAPKRFNVKLEIHSC